MLDEHCPERPCRAEVKLAIEVDVAEFPIADVEVNTIHLRLVVEEPVRRSDNAGPGLDFLRDELCRPFQNGRWLDRALVGELHDKPPTVRDTKIGPRRQTPKSAPSSSVLRYGDRAAHRTCPLFAGIFALNHKDLQTIDLLAGAEGFEPRHSVLIIERICGALGEDGHSLPAAVRDGTDCAQVGTEGWRRSNKRMGRALLSRWWTSRFRFRRAVEHAGSGSGSWPSVQLIGGVQGAVRR